MNFKYTPNLGTEDAPRWPMMRGQCIVCDQPWNGDTDYSVNNTGISGLDRLPLSDYWPGLHQDCKDRVKEFSWFRTKHGVWERS